MKIQKLVARIFFAAASFCWVGCNDNSVSPVVTPDTSSSVEPGSSSEPGSSATSSSSSEVRSSSSDERIPLMSATVYGIEPAFSSSSEETSSSSEEKSLTPNDSLGAALSAMDVCDGHGDIQYFSAYRASWLTPEEQGRNSAQYQMLSQVNELLKDEKAQLSKEKRSCLQTFNEKIGQFDALYGSPTPAEYDKWEAGCNDGTIVRSEAFEILLKDHEARSEKARAEEMASLETELKKCDD